MTLGELFPDAKLTQAERARSISGLAQDSRAVDAGSVFFAVPGVKVDGARFVRQALAAGAIAVVAPVRPRGLPATVAFIAAADMRAALTGAAARYYSLQPRTIAAVTGTSGKTSVAAFLRQLWLQQHHQAASLGTIGVVAPSGAAYGSLTTPDPVTLHATLDKLAREGVTHLAFEASSHGLDQHRLDGVRLSAAGFTNLSRDHLDYHANEDDYLRAKLRLFEVLLPPGYPAVIDADSDVAPRVIAACHARGLLVLSTGFKGDYLRLRKAERDGFDTVLQIQFDGSDFEVRLPLPGTFQASNALVAAGLCLATGGDVLQTFAGLSELTGAPGRLERAGEFRGAPILVDYAHKPDALEKVLSALRPLASGRLVVVFGCGGDRDAGKRPLMGEVASRLADIVVVTDDNPRSEAPAAIRAAILASARGAREIPDRAMAIAAAVELLQPGDVLVIAGKGHETGQIVGAATLPFSDHAAIAQALKHLVPDE